ncbi:four-carbon acid sugar kinase family protein [Falsirhodobacter deserti]|uniref:four-carbon acid sugar kinase family protein n=1 Tax=Falsirhodobacter deserti TaxID=1365611 RepID=UPI000FE3CF6A|nr:four-carbon acid sugar kinase family protein [Falsirhodobacter deserti]
MLRFAIIADDLTGALDAAAPFAGRGLQTRVALSPHNVPLDAEVVAISTNSREVGPKAAHDAVKRALESLPPDVGLMKKIDSRMKGNIAAEVSAFGRPLALLAPAIPDFGRITRHGHLVGFGVDHPIPLEIAGIKCLTPDIATTEDMRAAVATLGNALPVGARGLAEALALQMTGRNNAPAPLNGPRGVFVIGSRDPITLAQVAALDWPVVAAPNGVVPSAVHAPAVVQATTGSRSVAPEQVAANLAHGLRDIDTDTLFITGGATAGAVLHALGMEVLDLLGECMPGLPVSRANGMTIVTKSGGFGDSKTLATLARMITDAA